MVSRLLFRKLYRDLRDRKGAFLALAAIVAIGVAVYASMSSVYRDLNGARARYYATYRLPDFTVRLKRAPESSLARVAAIPGVKELRGRARLDVLLYPDDSTEPIPGVALSVPADREPVIARLMMKSGSRFSHTEAEEVILDDQFAEARGFKPGDRIKVLLLDKQRDLLVVGTAMSPEFVYLIPPGAGMFPDPESYGVMYLPRDLMQRACDLEGAYNELVGTTFHDAGVTPDNTLTLIEEELDAYGVANTVKSSDQPSVSVLRDELVSLKVTASVFPVIFLGVAALILNIMIGRLTSQQRTIIGTFRALGYSRSAIVFHYMGYGLVIIFIAGVVGLILGWRIQVSLLNMYKMFFALPGIKAHLHLDIQITAVIIAIVFAVVGTLKSSLSAAQMQPAEAMRPPPPERGRKVFFERIGSFWGRLSFGWKLILRSVFRNPFRSAVSLLAGIIATSLTLATICLYDGLYYMLNYHFEKVSHEDMTITTRDALGMKSVHEVAALPSVFGTEPQLSVVCDLSNGPYSKRTGVTGLTADAQLYTPLDASGNPVVIPDAGLVLTTKLAEILNVKVGDKVHLRPLIAERKTTEAPVVGVIDAFLGLSAYCHVSYLSKLLGEEWVSNTFLLSRFRDAPSGPLMSEIRRRPEVVGITHRERSMAKMTETMGQFMGVFFQITVLFAGIIAFGSVLNTALVSVSERQRDIGTFRVLGFSVGQIAKIFSSESFLLNGVGILIGLAVGIKLAGFLSTAYDTELYRFPVTIYPSRLVLVGLLIATFTALAQVAVYFMIRKLNWLEVLKIKE
jgi:putative ABC transport system permease protein